ncbi:MAG: helix-turn-helix domain-containing protein [Clostridia bacterium]|nr:helix-turn-helix domain-containing protein [Clostridia bacterium]
MPTLVKFKLNKVYLLEAMSDAGMTTWSDLSRKSGVANNTVSAAFRYSDGRVELQTAERIANALGVKLSKLGRRVTMQTYTQPEPENEEQKNEDEQNNSQIVNQLILRS